MINFPHTQNISFHCIAFPPLPIVQHVRQLFGHRTTLSTVPFALVTLKEVVGAWGRGGSSENLSVSVQRHRIASVYQSVHGIFGKEVGGAERIHNTKHTTGSVGGAKDPQKGKLPKRIFLRKDRPSIWPQAL